MAAKSYKDKLLDPRWQKMRLEVFQRENFTCQYCGDTKKTLHAHHISYHIGGNPWDVDSSAIMCLCDDCHYIEHITNQLSEEGKILISALQCYSMISDNKEDFVKYAVREINEKMIQLYPRETTKIIHTYKKYK